jgi:glutathionyl-hydroquinone reductase
MKNWIADAKPEILADSAFGSIDLLKDIENWGGHGTFSVQSNHQSYIWEALSANLPPNNWRYACNDKGWIASCSCVEDPNKQKKTYQLILSNAYQPSYSSTSTSITNNTQTEAIVNNSEVETMSIFDQEVLTKLSHATLKDLYRKHSIKLEN